MVRPGLDFFALVFAVFKAGIVPVLIDPGIGLRNLGQCCREAAPEVFIGIPKAVLAGRLLGWGRETVRRRILVAPAGRPSLPGAIPLDARAPGGRATRDDGRGRGRSPTDPVADRRAGGDPVHQRQHRAAQGGGLHPRHPQRPGRA